jgi:hypothetical protein
VHESRSLAATTSVEDILLSKTEDEVGKKKHLTNFGLQIDICTATRVFSQPNLVVNTNCGARVTANYTKLSKSRAHFRNKCTNKVPGNQSASWGERENKLKNDTPLKSFKDLGVSSTRQLMLSRGQRLTSMRRTNRTQIFF